MVCEALEVYVWRETQGSLEWRGARVVGGPGAAGAPGPRPWAGESVRREEASLPSARTPRAARGAPLVN